MSSFNVFRSLWTCERCLAASIPRSTLSQRPTLLRSPVTQPSNLPRAFSSQSQRWQRPQRHRGDDPSNHSSHNGSAKNPKGQRRLIVAAASVGTVGAAVLAAGDDMRHYSAAVGRTSTVVSTLALCVNDYRVTLKSDASDPEQNAIALKECHKRCALRTLHAMEKTGSIFIKLGQHLSSLTYLLPTEWCETFIPLQDKCPVSSYESIRDMIKHDTGQELEEFFSEFEEKPIGAASLAQVHRATLRTTGEQVAVKLQHPSLDEWAPLDLALTRFTFATLKKVFPEYDLTWLAEEMEVSLPQELDFSLEGKNAERAREYFGPLSLPVIIPRVVWARRRIIVMEYETGHRPDDLEYLDSHHIDRDEVAATLARIFNTMIFGEDAPLHCDPHGGNIAIRHNPKRRGALPSTRNANFDIILYDHGLYRDIPVVMRRSYAKLWLAVLDADEPAMRRYAREVAGISDADFPLFASAITGREYTVLTQRSGLTRSRDAQEKAAINNALGDGLLTQLVHLLGTLPRVLLLVLKTNDLTRSLDENLHTRLGPVRSFLILAHYASRTVYHEQLESITGSLFWPRNLWTFFRAWAAFARVELKLGVYESWLGVRGYLGLQRVELAM